MTSRLEAAAPRCSSCGAEPYLDASKNEMRCAVCECAHATLGGVGRLALDDLGSRAWHLGDSWLVEDAAALAAAVEREVRWSVLEDVLEDGTTLRQPREVSYEASGDALSIAYDYEHLKAPQVPVPFCDAIERLRSATELAIFGSDDGVFNSAFCNRYADGGSHVSWHTDEDVPLYGSRPIIASVSFGAPRDFVLRKNDSGDPPELVRYSLGNGALLVMSGATQRHWEHAVLKAAPVSGGAVGKRLNVTFRRVLAPPKRSPWGGGGGGGGGGGANALTGPEGTAFPYCRDAALSAALLVALPLDLLSLGGLRRSLESLGYAPGAPTYDVRLGRVDCAGDPGPAPSSWVATTSTGSEVVCCALRCQRKASRTIVFASGNAGDLGRSLPFARELARVLIRATKGCFHCQLPTLSVFSDQRGIKKEH